jgi:hypothetical protein
MKGERLKLCAARLLLRFRHGKQLAKTVSLAKAQHFATNDELTMPSGL